MSRQEAALATEQRSGCLLLPMSLLLVGLAALVLLGLYTEEIIPLAIGVLGLTTVGLSWGWSRLSNKHVYVEQQVTPVKSFVGAPLNLKLHMRNRKMLPVQLTIQLPAELLSSSDFDADQDGFELVRLGPFASAHKSITLRPRRRGLYHLSAVRFCVADPWGYFIHRRQARGDDCFWVYPRIYPVAGLTPPTRINVDGSTARPGPWPNRLHPSGLTTNYRGSIRDIDWSATARFQQVHYKQYDTSRRTGIAVLLHMTAPETRAECDHSELAISLVASLVWQQVQQGNPTMFVSNVAADEAHQPTVTWRLIRNQTEFDQLLQHLALLDPLQAGDHLWTIALAQQRREPWSTTPVIISGADLPEALASYAIEQAADVVFLNDAGTGGLGALRPAGRRTFSCTLIDNHFSCRPIAAIRRDES